MAGRWDFLYEQKAVSLTEHLVDELAKLIAQDLAGWPLAIDSFATPEDAARFARLLAPDSPRPGASVYLAAFLLARLELEREYEQIDEFMRNERWRAFAAPGRSYHAMILISRYLTEQMLAVLERTEGRVNRARLVECLGRAQKAWLAAAGD
jgi:hypothetical protein